MTETSGLPVQSSPLQPVVPVDHAAASDIDLFAAAQAGDYGAFEAVVKRFHQRVYRLVYGLTKSVQDAEEVVQETFLNVFRGLPSFKNESAPGSWIYRIAVNAALMRLRSRKRKPLLSIEDKKPGLDSLDEAGVWPRSNWARRPDDGLLSKELVTHVADAIERLPEKYRLVLLLRDVEGQSNEEAAHALGLTLPTTKSRLHRARLFVRHELERYFARQ